MPTKAEFRAALEKRFLEARQKGASEVEINSGALHRELGGYPAPSHQMPSCCDAMYEEQDARDVIVSAPKRGKGASLTIRYALPR